jgi:hypothetical protein
MAKVIFICDGCGKQQEGYFTRMGDAFKPNSWYLCTDEDGTQVACSRECIDKIALKSGKTRVIIPI